MALLDEFPIPPDMIRTLQEDTQRTLKTVLHTRFDVSDLPDNSPRSIPMRGIDVHVRMSLANLDCFAPAAQGNMLVIQGPPRDAFLFILYRLLNQEPIDRIQRCPGCATLFYRIGKQKYCSHTCANRAGVRRWRQNEAVKQAEAERAHNRYVKKMQPRIGKGTRVSRIPRKGNVNHAETPRQS